MKKKFNLLIACIIISFTLQAQTSYLQIGQGVRLPKDSIERKNLIESLDHFLQDITINSELPQKLYFSIIIPIKSVYKFAIEKNKRISINYE